jgi:hypothetical protein
MIITPKEAGYEVPLLIYPKLGSHEALGEGESESVNAEYWALREDSAASVAPPAAGRLGDDGSLRRR